MAGRPRKYQEVDIEKAMREQIDRACALFGPPYNEMLPDNLERCSIREVAGIMGISAVKVRRLLIAGNHYMTATVKAIQDRTEAGEPVEEVANALNLSVQSVKSYMPYEVCAYGIGSGDAEKMKAFRRRKAEKESADRKSAAVRALQANPNEDALWDCILVFRQETFHTVSGLDFTYDLKKGRNGEYTKELWISRREDSKPLTISTILLALNEAVKRKGECFRGPKSFLKVRGISYIYGMFLQWGLVKDEKIGKDEPYEHRMAGKMRTGG